MHFGPFLVYVAYFATLTKTDLFIPGRICSFVDWNDTSKPERLRQHFLGFVGDTISMTITEIRTSSVFWIGDQWDYGSYDYEKNQMHLIQQHLRLISSTDKHHYTGESGYVVKVSKRIFERLNATIPSFSKSESIKFLSFKVLEKKDFQNFGNICLCTFGYTQSVNQIHQTVARKISAAGFLFSK